MKKKLIAIVSGEVQGVGYRYNVYHIAKRFPITGFVHNLNDGTVEVHAEGEEKDLKQFAKEIAIKNGYINVIEIKQEWKSAENKFNSFQIIRSGF